MLISIDLAVLAQLVFIGCVIAVLEGIAVYTWQFRAEPGARWHAWSQSCKCLWLVALAVAMLGGDSTVEHGGRKSHVVYLYGFGLHLVPLYCRIERIRPLCASMA